MTEQLNKCSARRAYFPYQIYANNLSSSSLNSSLIYPLFNLFVFHSVMSFATIILSGAEDNAFESTTISFIEEATCLIYLYTLIRCKVVMLL